MADALRWTVILVCAFNVGVMLALYDRVGKAFLPVAPMRTLFTANGLIMVSIALATSTRLGEPMRWQSSPLLAVASIMELVALLAVYRWYGSVAGIEHIKRMTRKLSPPGGNRTEP